MNYNTVRFMQKAMLGLLVLVLVGCGQAIAPTTLPPIAALSTPPAPTLVASVAPTVALMPTRAALTRVVPTATPVPPRLLADRDSSLPRTMFGPVAPAGQWLVTRDAARFTVFNLRGQSSVASTFAPSTTLGLPLEWGANGALLLFTTPTITQTLWALEPTTGISTTLLSTTAGLIRGAAWLNTTIIYATERDELLLHAYGSTNQAQIVARLPNQRLVAMLTSPTRREVALIVGSTVSPTLELYRFDEQFQLLYVDRSTGGEADARAAWSARGELAYNLGDGLHIYNPATNSIQTTDLDALPLTWFGADVLARQRANGALVRWSMSGIQPFETGNGPLVVDDAHVINAREVALLIGGQVWQVTLEK